MKEMKGISPGRHPSPGVRPPWSALLPAPGVAFDGAEEAQEFRGEVTAQEAQGGGDQHRPPLHTYRVPWADLLEKVFAIDVLACPECGGRLRVIAFIAAL